ncbi:MAG: ABC transporter permease, partial [Bdellovibrionales bacterium]|nr:ABC transporter permease [Bdellovibrionales bacterium]
ILQLFWVLISVALITFSLLRIVPGDPIAAMLGDNATLVDREAMLKSLGLDQPAPIQFLRWGAGLIRGDLGTSWTSREPVSKLILESVGPTYELAFLAVALALGIGIFLGPLSASLAGKISDRIAMAICAVIQSTPTFWTGSILIFIFALHLDWFPMGDRESLSSYVLPTLTLGIALAASVFRLVRESCLSVLRADYVRTARAKGLPERRILYRHVLKSVAGPIVTIAVLQLGSLLGGATVTETLFDWPGLGTLLFKSLQARDFPVVQACVLVIAVTYVLVGFLGDVLSQSLDPRRRSL